MPKTSKKIKNKENGFAKYLTRKNLYWGLILSFLATYLFMRLLFLDRFPIFTDEAIYIRWAQIAANDPEWFFISLTDGKQPLFVWLAIIFMKFAEDPLVGARLVSVFAGLLSMIGLFFVAMELFKSRRIGFVAAFLYILYPFALVYDRMALYDSLVATFIIWALYFEILLIRRLKWYLAVILGVVIGLGLLNKTSSNFALILMPFLLLLFNFKDKQWKVKLLRLSAYAVIAAVISQAIYLLLKLSPFFYIIAQKNAVFVYPLEEWLQHPLEFVYPNLVTLTGWLVDYSTIPFLIFVFASFFFDRKNLRQKLLLLAWFIVPFFFENCNCFSNTYSCRPTQKILILI